MADLEKTIRGLECCTQVDNKGYPKCDRCPYADEKLGTCDAVRGLMKDALSLLKEQEPIKPIYDGDWIRCGSTGCYRSLGKQAKKQSVMQRVKCCPRCGKAVAWDV